MTAYFNPFFLISLPTRGRGGILRKKKEEKGEK